MIEYPFREDLESRDSEKRLLKKNEEDINPFLNRGRIKNEEDKPKEKTKGEEDDS